MADDPQEPPLGPEDEEIASIRRLSVVADHREGADVLVFRNSAGEPIVVPSAVATEAERAYRCYQLRQSGKDWTEIALAEQYPSAKAAKYDVDRYLEEARSLVVESSAREMLRLEISRLDRLQSFIWDKAADGNIAAITEIRQLVMSRVRVVEVLEPSKTEEVGGDMVRTVVVASDEAGYLRGLQKAAGALPAEP